MPMSGCAAEERGRGGRGWRWAGLLEGRVDWGAIDVDIWLQREYHCSVGTKEPRTSRGAAEGRQKGD
jgi:hypothetical protein